MQKARADRAALPGAAKKRGGVDHSEQGDQGGGGRGGGK